MRRYVDQQDIIRCLVTIVLTQMATMAWAWEHPTTPVPPSLEIEVLDPNADPLGNPAVELRYQHDGSLAVDIPPLVLVHRYYYTGDRSFQGPLIPGGPTIVVVNHPKTGERVYVPVQMLPGAPKVSYSHRSITYDFGENAIKLAFGPFGRPKVSFRNGVAFGTRAKSVAVGIGGAIGSVTMRSGMPERVANLARGTKNFVIDAADGIDTATEIVITPLTQIWNVLPLTKTLSRTPEDRAIKARDDSVRRAAKRAALTAVDIPTNR